MAGLSLSLLLVATVVWVAVGRDSHQVELSPSPPDAPSAAAAARVLQDLARAWSAGDAAAARALAPDGDERAADQLAEVAENVRAAGLTGLSLRYVDEAGPSAADGTWSAAADLTWQVEGFDPTPARSEVRVTLVPDHDGAVAVAGLGGGDLREPVWFQGAAEVRRTATLVVVADADLGRRAVARVVRLSRRALPEVLEVVRGWRPRLVVEVPADAAGVDRALGARAGTYERVAAVTATADGSGAPDAAVRVLLNPEEMDRLGGIGAQVVMTHEVAHVALGAASSSGSVPLWLVEGTADVVALRHVRLPLDRTAGQVARQVRREGVPDHLPGPEEFDTVASGHLGAAYEAAWLACTVVVDRAGIDALLAVYRATEQGMDPDRALRRHAGMSQDELLRTWQGRLSDLAS